MTSLINLYKEIIESISYNNPTNSLDIINWNEELPPEFLYDLVRGLWTRNDYKQSYSKSVNLIFFKAMSYVTKRIEITDNPKIYSILQRIFLKPINPGSFYNTFKVEEEELIEITNTSEIITDISYKLKIKSFKVKEVSKEISMYIDSYLFNQFKPEFEKYKLLEGTKMTYLEININYFIKIGGLKRLIQYLLSPMHIFNSIVTFQIIDILTNLYKYLDFKSKKQLKKYLILGCERLLTLERSCYRNFKTKDFYDICNQVEKRLKISLKELLISLSFRLFNSIYIELKIKGIVMMRELINLKIVSKIPNLKKVFKKIIFKNSNIQLIDNFKNPLNLSKLNISLNLFKRIIKYTSKQVHQSILNSIFTLLGENIGNFSEEIIDYSISKNLFLKYISQNSKYWKKALPYIIESCSNSEDELINLIENSKDELKETIIKELFEKNKFSLIPKIIKFSKYKSKLAEKFKYIIDKSIKEYSNNHDSMDIYLNFIEEMMNLSENIRLTNNQLTFLFENPSSKLFKWILKIPTTFENDEHLFKLACNLKNYDLEGFKFYRHVGFFTNYSKFNITGNTWKYFNVDINPLKIIGINVLWKIVFSSGDEEVEIVKEESSSEEVEKESNINNEENVKEESIKLLLMYQNLNEKLLLTSKGIKYRKSFIKKCINYLDNKPEITLNILNRFRIITENDLIINFKRHLNKPIKKLKISFISSLEEYQVKGLIKIKENKTLLNLIKKIEKVLNINRNEFKCICSFKELLYKYENFDLKSLGFKLNEEILIINRNKKDNFNQYKKSKKLNFKSNELITSWILNKNYFKKIWKFIDKQPLALELINSMPSNDKIKNKLINLLTVNDEVLDEKKLNNFLNMENPWKTIYNLQIINSLEDSLKYKIPQSILINLIIKSSNDRYPLITDLCLKLIKSIPLIDIEKININNLLKSSIKPFINLLLLIKNYIPSFNFLIKMFNNSLIPKVLGPKIPLNWFNIMKSIFNDLFLNHYYLLYLSKLLKKLTTEETEVEHNSFKKQISKKIILKLENYKSSLEQFNSLKPDFYLISLLKLLKVSITKKFKFEKVKNLLFKKILFGLPESEEEEFIPFCKTYESRNSALKLLNKIISKEEDYKILINYLNDSKPPSQLIPKKTKLICNTQYKGFINQGNTCYLNSTLQQFFFTPELRYKILSFNKIENNLFNSIQYIFSSLLKTVENSVKTIGFTENYLDWDGNPIDVRIQMDAFELINGLFGKMEGIFLENEIIENPFKKLFCGKVSSQIIPTEGTFISETLQDFYSISLDVKGKNNIYSSLEEYIKGEMLSGDSQYYCEEYGKKVNAIKRTLFHSLPPYLIIHLKRFEYDLITWQRYKVNEKFEFPLLNLNMFPFTTESSSSDLEDSDLNPKYNYNLVGIIIQSGNPEIGHYYSYCKGRINRKGEIDNKWFKCDDSRISEWNIKENLENDTFGGKGKEYSAYILFYERNDYTHLNELIPSFSNSTNNLMNKIYKENLIWYKNQLLFNSNCFSNFFFKQCIKIEEKRGGGVELTCLEIKFIFQSFLKILIFLKKWNFSSSKSTSSSIVSKSIESLKKLIKNNSIEFLKLSNTNIFTTQLYNTSIISDLYVISLTQKIDLKELKKIPKLKKLKIKNIFKKLTKVEEEEEEELNPIIQIYCYLMKRLIQIDLRWQGIDLILEILQKLPLTPSIKKLINKFNTIEILIDIIFMSNSPLRINQLTKKKKEFLLIEREQSCLALSNLINSKSINFLNKKLFQNSKKFTKILLKVITENEKREKILKIFKYLEPMNSLDIFIDFLYEEPYEKLTKIFKIINILLFKNKLSNYEILQEYTYSIIIILKENLIYINRTILTIKWIYNILSKNNKLKNELQSEIIENLGLKILVGHLSKKIRIEIMKIFKDLYTEVLVEDWKKKSINFILKNFYKKKNFLNFKGGLTEKFNLTEYLKLIGYSLELLPILIKINQLEIGNTKNKLKLIKLFDGELPGYWINFINLPEGDTDITDIYLENIDFLKNPLDILDPDEFAIQVMKIPKNNKLLLKILKKLNIDFFEAIVDECNDYFLNLNKIDKFTNFLINYITDEDTLIKLNNLEEEEEEDL